MKTTANKSVANESAIARFLQFLDASPTPFHAVANVAARLHAAGYVEVDEGAAFHPKTPGKYYFTRNGSSLIAAALTRAPGEHGFRMVGAHTDSPCLKVKPNAICCNDGYIKLAVEVYGGALLNPWFDRGLGLAGRVVVDNANGVAGYLINIKRPLAVIPSLAIHLDRTANDNRAINRQNELPAVLCRAADDARGEFNFDELLRAQLVSEYGDTDNNNNKSNNNNNNAKCNLKDARILAFELSLYDCQPAELVGLNNEFIAAARLDNLLSCHAGVDALLDAPPNHNNLLILTDHEEVGSVSAAGADGAFLQSVARRLCADDIETARAIRHSMLVSADNAHGVHPNYAHKHEPNHRPLLNAGAVIKINANQSYATNAETAAVFRRLCERRRLAVQTFVARTDMGCGSTIGPITAGKLGVRTVDVGAPQLAMHSIRELAGAQDYATLTAALHEFFTTDTWEF